MNAQNMYLETRARLDRAGEHWQRAITEGDPLIGWEGDRALVIYHEVITDEIVINYELPNQKPVLVFKVPAHGFDIKKVCTMLRDADHRRRDADEIIAEADAHNDAVRAAEDATKAEVMGAAQDKLHWAIGRDAGGTIAPLTITSNPWRGKVSS